MEVFSYRLVNNRYFCYTCNAPFNTMVHPDHPEAVRCSQCGGEFIEMIERRQSQPEGFERVEPAQTQSRAAPQSQPQQQPEAQPSRGRVPVEMVITELDLNGTRIYHYSVRPVLAQPEEEQTFSFGGRGTSLFDLFSLLSSQQNSGHAGAPPASKEAVKRLPVFKVEARHCRKNGDKLEPPTCAVCCNDLAIGQTAQQLPCGHMFHPECTKPWLEEHNTCPVCRHELPTDDIEYETMKRQQQRATEEQARSGVNA